MTTRKVYSRPDYGQALMRGRSSLHILEECQILHMLTRLLKDGDNQSADAVAANFLDQAPENRKTARAIALLRLAADRTYPCGS